MGSHSSTAPLGDRPPPRSRTDRTIAAIGFARGRTSWRVLGLAALLLTVQPPRLDAAPEPSTAASMSAAAPDEARRHELAAAIDGLLGDSFLATATVGISVVDLANGKTLYARGAHNPLNPASNVKLVTTAAALQLLGPEHRYATRLYRDNDALVGSVVKGDVYLQGSGDPSLVTEDLFALAGELHAQGIRRITGGVVVDSSAFDRDELPPGFDQKEELASYRAPSGATSVNFNTFVLRARPGTKVGDPPWAGIDPPVAGLELVNEASTDESHRRRLVVDIRYEDSPTRVILRGTLGRTAGTVSYRYPVQDPAGYAGSVMALALEQNGIKLGRKRVKVGKPPGDARLLALHTSEPLSVLVRGVNKYSNNFMAEQILKTLSDPSRPATFDDALACVRAHLGDLGLPTDGLRLGNGSGLYDTNRISADQITRLLIAVHRDFRVSSDFLASLAIMGADGTTRSRLRESTARRWVRAKTGTLDGVSALSGYVGAEGRDPIAFSILFNDLGRADTPRARRVQNEIAELLVRYASGGPLAITATDPTTAVAGPEAESEEP